MKFQQLYIIFLLLFVLIQKTNAQNEGESTQTKKLPHIKIDIDAEETTTVLPFDQRFKFESFKTVYDSIYFCYSIKAGNRKDWHYMTGREFPLRIKKTTGVAVFPESIEPLHPNLPYTFQFLAYKKVELKPEEKSNLKNETVNLIKDRFSNSQNTKTSDIDVFKRKIIALLRKYAKAESIYNSNGTLLNIDFPLYKTYLYPAIDRLEGLSKDINDRLEPNISDRKNRIFEEINKDKNVIVQIFKICNGDIKPSPKLTSKLNSVINSTVENNSTLTVEQLGTFFFDDYKYNLNAILNKNQKITGASLTPSNQLDKNSIILLKSFFDKIISNNTTDNNNNKVIFDEGSIMILENIRDSFEEIIIKLNEIDNRKLKIRELSNLIPDALDEAYVLDNITLEESIMMDLTSQKNAYIGIDLGIVYAFSPQSFFIYEGTNIYFRPVNREALFSDLEGWDEFFKRFSVYIGIAQLLTDKPDDFEPLFGKNSLLTGVGWRLNRTFRLNFGGLMYYKTDPNPLITDKSLKISPTVSFSADIDVIKAMGSVGKILNITQ
ncbi:hypothetical protein [Confluentibacter sediminis]|uniref:hypothetical protein n=1 Tax=Confluentibacter sediminis TaxID=2219045 RepID=UPI000DACAE67|nr:hypothetical protein [Confluentibacter sediminis]